MIYSVAGTLIHADPKCAVIECGGVGFACQISMQTARQLPAIGKEARLLTAMNVREDAIELYGFAEKKELDCFRLLTTVSGVGPRVGMAILSELTADKVALAVAAGDFKALTKAAGVGPKLAQRIVLELKDKCGAVADTSGVTMSDVGAVSAAGNAAQAVSALTVLGFSAGEAAAAVGKLDGNLPVETLVRQALRSLASKG